jgi:CheY-like chemotaxis protein
MASQFQDLDWPKDLKFTLFMALRVLLADESNAIKKVFQLALQDFAVDVRSVNIGADVLETARTFKPDIIFADVLLQKKNGYDVANEVKADKGLRSTPIVLMWSGFMELDQDKFQASRADDRLEKPFDVEALRQLVRNYVPRTQTQSLSEYLEFPKMPDIEDDPAVIKRRAQEAGLVARPPSEKNFSPPSEPQPRATSNNQLKSEASWGMDSFDPIDQFKERPIAETHTADAEDKIEGNELILELGEEEGGDVEWVKKDISAFQVDPRALAGDLPEANYSAPVEEISLEEVGRLGTEKAHETFDLEEIEPVDEAAPAPSGQGAYGAFRLDQIGLTEEKIQEIVRQAVQDAVWKIVPELAQQMIAKEIERLTAEDSAL